MSTAKHNTEISWTHLPGYRGCSWNPLRGCSRVSPGCQACYAETHAGRFCGEGLPFEGYATRGPAGARWTGKVDLLPAKLAEPLGWKQPRCVFVNSMSDLFHEELSFEDIAAVFGVMAACPQHVFIVLTKRAERMPQWFEEVRKLGGGESNVSGSNVALHHAQKLCEHSGLRDAHGVFERGWPLPNVWLCVSAEDQQRWDERVPHLLRCPAAVRGVSIEPMLGSIIPRAPHRGDVWWTKPGGLDWLVVGAESGNGARPFDPEWARPLLRGARNVGAAFFMKQTATPAGQKVTDLDKLPADLRVREWPVPV